MFHRTQTHRANPSPPYLAPPQASELLINPLLRTADEVASSEIVEIAVSLGINEEMPKVNVSVQAA